MATTQHYLWAGGHFLLLLSGSRYFLAWMMFKTVSSWWYKASFLGALMSYFITPQPNMAYVRRALADENVQYFLLAIFWWTSRPVTCPPQPHPLAKKLHLWVKANYDTAMRVVAIAELVIFARVLFGALLFRNSLMMPLVYAQFLHQRYFHSQFTPVGQVWLRVRELVVRFGASAVVEPAAPRRD
ncbi:uncharacterized protein EDB91DRAFT_1235187 [Suillus paluster]|uniref:uncharacterized protein n=1 Tax=Suillus paluster TaxID=48578 RepID=UPI001B87C7CD|nr:uncharacterized protein EDB91DRAFT_1235187 [Suillus paluster]KAG1749716.1 hypothetical protein EDB91DRAFT_1235187 [Suillus paluster]